MTYDQWLDGGWPEPAEEEDDCELEESCTQ
jgi:hypothetical protein